MTDNNDRKPWFKMRAADQLADSKMRQLTDSERGILLDVWCYLWSQTDQPGKAIVGGKSIGVEGIVRALCVHYRCNGRRKYRTYGALQTLIKLRLLVRDEAGVLCAQSMVKDYARIQLGRDIARGYKGKYPKGTPPPPKGKHLDLNKNKNKKKKETPPGSGAHEGRPPGAELDLIQRTARAVKMGHKITHLGTGTEAERRQYLEKQLDQLEAQTIDDVLGPDGKDNGKETE